MDEALQQLLALVQPRVSPLEYQLVVRNEALLSQHELLTEGTICGTSKQELIQIGFSLGAAAALKKAFPDPEADTTAGTEAAVAAALRRGTEADEPPPKKPKTVMVDEAVLVGLFNQLMDNNKQLSHQLMDNSNKLSQQIAIATATATAAATAAASAAATAAEVMKIVRRKELRITASECKTETCVTVMQMLQAVYKVEASRIAPCCLHAQHLQPLRHLDTPRFSWQAGQGEDSMATTTAAIRYLTRYVLPDGVFAWPVQKLNWLNTSVDCAEQGTLIIENSRTDYILFMTGKHQEIYSLVQELSKKKGVLKQHLVLLVPYMVALWEAKPPGQLLSIEKPRCQAVVEYVGVNEHRPEDIVPVPVVLSDFNKHHCVHSGGTFKDALRNKQQRCIHIASPASLAPILEADDAGTSLQAGVTGSSESAVTNPADAAQKHTIRFVQTLLADVLQARLLETARKPTPTLAELTELQDDDDQADGAGGAGHGEREGNDNDMDSSAQFDDGMGEGQGGHGSNVDWANANPGPSGIQGGLNLEMSTLSIGARSSSLSSPEACSDSSNGSGTDDEGVLEAAIENAKAQRIMSVLKQPKIYKGLGLEKPPAYTPRSKEQFWNSMRLLPFDDE